MYNSNTRPLALRFLPPKADGNTILAGVNRGLFKNHVVMCTTFSILHGIVDGTLAFVVAELGTCTYSADRPHTRMSGRPSTSC